MCKRNLNMKETYPVALTECTARGVPRPVLIKSLGAGSSESISYSTMTSGGDNTI